MENTSNTSYTEGQNTTRPPFFNGLNYSYWSTRMRIFMQASGFDTWNIIQSEYTIPTTEYATWSNTQKIDATANAKAMNMLFCALDKNEFNRVSICKTGYEIWNTLRVTHEGTTKVKQSKISMLKNQFQTFRMKQGESISEMYSRFQDIHHSLIALGVTYSEPDVVSKILNSLTDEWERKVLAIEEANDISTIKAEELIGNLMSYEVNLQAKRVQAQDKKNIAFHAEEEENQDSDDENLAFIAKNFKKFLKYRKNDRFKDKKNFSNKPSSSAVECYNCHKKGHIQKDCTEQKKSYSNKGRKDKKKAFSVTWDDSDSSSSESDTDSDNEQANVCFMATDNEVSDLTFDDLIEINSELLDTLKSLKRKYKETREYQNKAEFERDMLKDEKIILEEELGKLQESFSNINSQLTLSKQECEILKEKNDAIISENHELKEKIKQTDLDNMNLKNKLEDISKNVSNFNKGRENLFNIIENSQSVSNKKGLGYDKESKAPQKHENERRIDFRPSTTKPILKELKTIRLWVPKTNNSLIRKKYITSFIESVHKNKNYIYKGKTEPSWVWFPKI